MEPEGSWVLVCDDTASIRLLIRINLELAGFGVVEAADGSAGVALLESRLHALPAAVVLDAQMRPLDGWGTVEAIRANRALRDLPVVMVTASLQQQEQERSVQVGVDAFLAKPFEPEHLVDVVTTLAAHGRPRSSA